MKKVLCYIALLLLVAIIVLPPTLRLMDSIKTPSNNDSKDVAEMLRCVKENETVVAPYLNYKILNMHYIFSSSLIEEDTSFTSILKQKMESLNINPTIEDGKYDYYLLFSDEYLGNENVSELNRSIEEQNAYYANMGYTCSIIK